jgi:polysaccharide pyruvyl transferase WcaK-like protein
MKLHSQILAICAGVPTIAVEYQPKTSDFMASIGAVSEVVRIDALSAPILWERIKALSAQREGVAHRQWLGCHDLRRRFLAYVEELGGATNDLVRWTESDYAGHPRQR